MNPTRTTGIYVLYSGTKIWTRTSMKLMVLMMHAIGLASSYKEYQEKKIFFLVKSFL